MTHSLSWALLEHSWQNTSWELLHCCRDGRWTQITLPPSSYLRCRHVWHNCHPHVETLSPVLYHLQQITSNPPYGHTSEWKNTSPICRISVHIRYLVVWHLRCVNSWYHRMKFSHYRLQTCTHSLILITLNLWRRQVCLILGRIVLQRLHCRQCLLHWLRADNCLS